MVADMQDLATSEVNDVSQIVLHAQVPDHEVRDALTVPGIKSHRSADTCVAAAVSLQRRRDTALTEINFNQPMAVCTARTRLQRLAHIHGGMRPRGSGQIFDGVRNPFAAFDQQHVPRAEHPAERLGSDGVRGSYPGLGLFSRRAICRPVASRTRSMIVKLLVMPRPRRRFQPVNR